MTFGSSKQLSFILSNNSLFDCWWYRLLMVTEGRFQRSLCILCVIGVVVKVSVSMVQCLMCS